MSKRTKVCDGDLESFILGIKDDYQGKSTSQEQKKEEIVHTPKPTRGLDLVLDVYGLIWNDIFEGVCVKLHVFNNYRIAKKEIKLCLYLKYLICHTFNKSLEYKVYILHSIETAINMLRYIIYFEEHGYAPVSKINQCRLYCYYLTNHIKQRRNDMVTVIVAKLHLYDMDKHVDDTVKDQEHIENLIKKTFDSLDNNKLRLAVALNGYSYKYQHKKRKKKYITPATSAMDMMDDVFYDC